MDDGKIKVDGGPLFRNAKLKIYDKPFPNNNIAIVKKSNSKNNTKNSNMSSTSNATHFNYSNYNLSCFDTLWKNIDTNDICGFNSMFGRIGVANSNINMIKLKVSYRNVFD